MLLITRLYIRFWNRRHRPPCFILSDGHMLVRRPAIPAAPNAATALVRFRGTTRHGTSERARGSLRLDARELDPLRPLANISADELGELVRRVRRHRHGAEIGEQRCDCRR